MEALDEILEAIKSNSELAIVYHGGSRPGSERRVTPISLEGPGLRARCHITGQAKLFSLNKIQIGDSKVSIPASLDDAPAAPTFANLEEVFNYYRDTLEGLGWHIRTDFSEDYACISLHGKFKNGNIKKEPDLNFAYKRLVEESYFDGDDWVMPEPPRESTRPFGVYGKFTKGGPYGKIERAMAVFVKEAVENAPDY